MGKIANGKSKDEDWKVSAITHNYPSYRKNTVMDNASWLQGKRDDDGAEGLWRIRDTLYDFTDFVDRHPGGKFWLEVTKGLDITESFESNHFSTLPESIIKKYEIRKAKTPRNYKLTMHKDGFFMTLKSRIREELKTVDYSVTKTTDYMHTGLIVATLLLGILGLRTGSTIIQVLDGLSLCWLAIASHNYFHRRDNWRMYAFNLSLLNFRSWRVSHALSHHVYPNSLLDLEISIFEPLLCWIPNKHLASKTHRIITAILQPVIFLGTYFVDLLARIVITFTKKTVLFWDDLIFLILPTVMYLGSNDTLANALSTWFFILLSSSFLFAFLGLTSAHHTPEIYHEGDTMRDDLDWGLYQLDTIIDRKDVRGSRFMVLTHFGDHVLHHLFPTLDHGILPQLYPVLEKTLSEFKGQLRTCSHLEHIIGQTQQLLRTTPNPLPPSSCTK